MTTVAEPQRGTREASPVLAFLGRRLLGASLLIFAGTAILPGDAASVVLGRGATPQAVKELDQRLHLDRPLLTQYTTWLGGFIHGDLGDSSVGLAQGQKDAPVWDLISSPVKNSLILALVTAIFMIPLSLGLGALAAVYAGRPVDHAISIGSLAAIALPEFVIGSLLIGVFFVWLDVLPPVALIPPGSNPLSDPSKLVLEITERGVPDKLGVGEVQEHLVVVQRQPVDVQQVRVQLARDRRVFPEERDPGADSTR